MVIYILVTEMNEQRGKYFLTHFISKNRYFSLKPEGVFLSSLQWIETV